jgi:predicted TPR repeat methyltransferase
VELAQRAVELTPKDSDTWSVLGVAHYCAGHCEQSVAALEKAIELRKTPLCADWLFLAMAHWRLGDKAQVLKDLRSLAHAALPRQREEVPHQN